MSVTPQEFIQKYHDYRARQDRLIDRILGALTVGSWIVWVIQFAGFSKSYSLLTMTLFMLLVPPFLIIWQVTRWVRKRKLESFKQDIAAGEPKVVNTTWKHAVVSTAGDGYSQIFVGEDKVEVPYSFIHEHGSEGAGEIAYFEHTKMIWSYNGQLIHEGLYHKFFK